MTKKTTLKTLARRTAAIFAAALMAMLFLVSCAPSDDGHGNPDANRTVPADSDVTLAIDRDGGTVSVYGVGVELDPHFFSQNVGLSGHNAQVGSWECKQEDWELFVQRMRDMNLKRIRVMLLPNWYANNEQGVREGVYDWDTAEMQSLYRVLDTAKELSIKVNITMWGCNLAWLRATDNSDWVTYPKPGGEQLFADIFAGAVKYLIEQKEYTEITEITLYNEPNSLYYGTTAADDYAQICRMTDTAFRQKGIRERVLFNLSDDARSPVWMASALQKLEGVIDVVNSHTYVFGDSYNSDTDSTNRDMSNEDICYNIAGYNLEIYRQMREGYEHIPHIWGEFGTRNGSGSHATFDKLLPDRGIDIPRIALNMFNMGSAGMSYWVLFSQYYSRSEFGSGKIMDMGLWGFADEGYNARPVYYAYSMMTRFIEEGDQIYTIQSADGNIVATAFRQGDKWTYAVVNNGDTSKTISFLNDTLFPTRLKKFIYEEANVPTDNQVIPSSGELSANGRVLTDTLAPRSFAIYTNRV